jgi:alkylation response protein AidB-like acyl-CoA dehydrogenase
LVRKEAKGLKTFKIEKKMALRAVQNANIEMHDVFVPDDERFELAKDFASGTKEVLMHSRIFVAWMAAGMAAGALEAAMAYCQERI